MHRLVKFKMDETCNNISSYDYYIFYLKNSRLIALIWLILTICTTICLIIVFASPNWIGDGPNSSNRGYFGLYQSCVFNRFSSAYKCTGTWTDFNTLLDSAQLRAACFFVGFASLLLLLCIFISMFALLIKVERIIHIIAWIQFLCCKL